MKHFRSILVWIVLALLVAVVFTGVKSSEDAQIARAGIAALAT